MTDSKPCRHCKKPMYKKEFAPSNWDRVKTHRDCRGRYKRKQNLETDTAYLNKYISISWGSA